MKLGITVVGIAARLARWRIARARDAAIQSALQQLAAQRRLKTASPSDATAAPSNSNAKSDQERS